MRPARSASGWEPLSSLLRVALTVQSEAELRGVVADRLALEGGRELDVRLVTAARAADLLIIAGKADWLRQIVRESRAIGDIQPIVAINVTPAAGATAQILDAGADDCLSFPFESVELGARVRAVMRRSGSAWQRCPEIAADRAGRRIRVHGVEASVSPKQLDIFICLAERRDRWVHSDEIIAIVSGTCHQPASSLVRVQIHALRKALGAARACLRSDGRKSYMLSLVDLPGSSSNPSSLLRNSGERSF